jgi:ketosteroid isomerase-like protein
MAALVALAACSPEAVPTPAPAAIDWASLTAGSARLPVGKMSATVRERAAAGAYLAALSSPDLGDLGHQLDDNAHFTLAGLKDVHGRDGFVHANQALFADLTPRNVAASRILLTEDAQVIEWTLTGMQRETEKPVAFRGVSLVWTKDDGSITDLHLYFDQAVLEAELSSNPKAAAKLPLPPLPAGPPEVVEQLGTPEERENVLAVRRALDALESNQESAYVAAMDDDLILTTLEDTPPLRGKAGARTYFRAIHKSVARLDTTIDNIWGIGPCVAVEYHIVGEQTGPIGHLSAETGNLVKLFFVDVLELRAGKIARVFRYDNPSPTLVIPP